MSNQTQVEDTDKSVDNDLVIIDYQDLLLPPTSSTTTTTTADSNKVNTKRQKLHSIFHKAFGTSTSLSPSPSPSPSPSSSKTNTNNSLGLIAIRNIPNFIKSKTQFLPLAYKLATLPPSKLSTLTNPKSMYNSGWSHGKEKLKNNQPDLSKGCFYFNPIVDVPGTIEEREMYPTSYPVNIWPGEDMIPGGGFERCGKDLGCLMKDVVTLLASHIDDYVKAQMQSSGTNVEKEGEGEGYSGSACCMGEEMKHTEKVKGRLLYYFPQDTDMNRDETKNNNNNNNDPEIDSWIGWHNDSGFLTALAGDIYVDHDTGEIIPKDEIDPKAGLYVQDRSGDIRQIRIPDDCMAIQIGECLQIITGGHVVATPHCVRGADPNWECSSSDDTGTTVSANTTRTVNGKKRKVARISFPCFVDTVPSFPLTVPPGRTRDDIFKSGVVGCAKVPPLEERWTENGMDFGSFLQKTFALYYDWTKTK